MFLDKINCNDEDLNNVLRTILKQYNGLKVIIKFILLKYYVQEFSILDIKFIEGNVMIKFINGNNYHQSYELEIIDDNNFIVDDFLKKYKEVYVSDNRSHKLIDKFNIAKKYYYSADLSRKLNVNLNNTDEVNSYQYVIDKEIFNIRIIGKMERYDERQISNILLKEKGFGINVCRIAQIISENVDNKNLKIIVENSATNESILTLNGVVITCNYRITKNDQHYLIHYYGGKEVEITMPLTQKTIKEINIENEVSGLRKIIKK